MMRTSELTGAMLDYWVARAEGIDVKLHNANEGMHARCWSVDSHGRAGARVCPSSNWAQGGPIIEREKLELTPLYDMRNCFVYWSSQPPGMGHLAMEDEAPLVAAMRAYVASKFGEEVQEGSESNG